MFTGGSKKESEKHVSDEDELKILGSVYTWRKHAIRACLTVLMLTVLLGSVYTQLQPYKFTSSYKSIQNALLVDESKKVKSIEGIWNWLGAVTDNMGGLTVDSMQITCALPEPRSQPVHIDNRTYELYDPRVQYGSCEDTAFIPGVEEELYLTGNHQLLLFGIFAERSPQQLTIDKAIGNFPSIPVNTDDSKALNALTDNKIVEVCEAPWNSAQYCVSEDGYVTRAAGALGSSLGWSGRRVQGRRAFGANQSSSVFRSGLGLQPLLPCFTYRAEDADVLLFGNVSHSFVEDPAGKRLHACKYIWLTSGYDLRKFCAESRLRAPRARDYYTAKVLGFAAVDALLDFTAGCSAVLAMSAAALSSVRAETPWVLDTHLRSVELYGTFFDTTTKEEWIADTRSKLLTANAFNVIDESTRVFWTYAVLRNLGPSDLYYTVVRHAFVLKTDGTIRVEYQANFVPIIQYVYGIDEYPLIMSEVLFFEILLLVALFALLGRQFYHVYQVVKGATEVVKSRKISPVREGDVETGAADAVVAIGEAPLDSSSCSSCSSGSAAGQRSSQPQPPAPVSSVKSPVSVRRKSVAALVFQQKVQDISGTLSELRAHHTCSIFDVLDWSMVFVVLVAVVVRMMYISACRTFQQFVTARRSDFEEIFEDIISLALDVEEPEANLRIIMIVAVFLGVVQFFRYMSFDPRMGTVTSTIVMAAKDLLPVLLMFVITLLAYAIMGSQIYGQSVDDFSTLKDSLDSLFLMLLGDFTSYYKMRDHSTGVTTVYFSSFIVIILFLLFNMILAVILSVYEQNFHKSKQESDSKRDLRERVFRRRSKLKPQSAIKRASRLLFKGNDVQK